MNHYELLPKPELLEICFSDNLVPSFNRSREEILHTISVFRKELLQTEGIEIPKIRIRNFGALKDNCVKVMINGTLFGGAKAGGVAPEEFVDTMNRIAYDACKTYIALIKHGESNLNKAKSESRLPTLQETGVPGEE